MWKVGVPFELWYTNRMNWAIVDWVRKLLPKQGEKYSDKVSYNGDWAFRIEPFKQGFELMFGTDGTLFYRLVGSEGWNQSVISTDGIENYYRTIVEAHKLDRMLPLPVNLEADGSKASYQDCKYCPLNPVCNTKKAKPKKLSQWVELCKEFLKT